MKIDDIGLVTNPRFLTKFLQADIPNKGKKKN